MKQFWKRNVYLYIAFFVPFCIMGLAFILHEFYPFGDQQILLVDLWHQYFPFLRELHEKLIHGGSLLYSWDIGMGTNFWGLMSYYCASPLNLLLVLVPANYLIVGLQTLVLIKLGLASAFAAYFLRSVFKRNHFGLVIFGTVYGLSGFVFGYYWNVMWLDTMALLPLVALGIHKIMEKKDFRLYVIALALSLFSNYYMGLFTCIFAGFYYFGVCLYRRIKGKELLKGIGRMFLFSLIGIGLAAILLLPAYLCLQNTYYASSVFPESPSFFYGFQELIQNLYAFQDPSYLEGAPNLYSGILPLLFAAAFFSARKIPVREKIYYGLLLVFLVLSCNLNILDYIWHGFHYTNMVPHRFVFLFTFIVMLIGYRGFLAWRRTDLFDTLAVLFFGGIFLALGFFQLERKIWIANLILAVILFLLILLFKKRIMPWKVFCVVVSMVLLTEYTLEGYNSIKVAGKSQFSTYPADEEAVETLVGEMEELESDSTEFYRVEFETPYTLNDAPLFGTHGVTCFSSMCSGKLSYLLEKLGLAADDGSNRYAYHKTSPFVSSILNVKYLITREGALASKTWTNMSSNTHLLSYRNDYELPIGFMTKKEILDTDIDLQNPFDIQNEMFTKATGVEEHLFEKVLPDRNSGDGCTVTGYEDESYYMESTDTEKAGLGRVVFPIEVGEEYLAYIASNLDDSVEIYGPGYVRTVTVEYPFIIDLKEADSQGEWTFCYNVEAGGYGDTTLYVRTLDEEVFEKGYEKLDDEPFLVTGYTDRSIEGTVSAQEDGYLFTSIPYDKGWTLYVDGVKTEIEPFKEALIGVYLEKGEHEIQLTYLPGGFTVGSLITGAALAAFIVLWVRYHKKQRKALSNSEKETGGLKEDE